MDIIALIYSDKEQKLSGIEQLVAAVHWGVGKLRRYTTFAVKVEVVVEDDAYLVVLKD